MKTSMIRIHHRRLGALALASIAGVLACGGSDTTAPTQQTDPSGMLAQAETLWKTAGPPDYSYDLVSDRFGQHDSVQVQVEGDQVTVSKSYITGQPSTLGEAMPDLFSILDDAVTTGLNLSATYDTQFGYPARASVYPPTTTAANGISWQIVNFARLP